MTNVPSTNHNADQQAGRDDKTIQDSAIPPITPAMITLPRM